MTSSAYMAPEVGQSLFGDRHSALAWGAQHNHAKAVIVPGGYRVTGVWDFASGNRHAPARRAYAGGLAGWHAAPVPKGKPEDRDGAVPARRGADHAGMGPHGPAGHRQRRL